MCLLYRGFIRHGFVPVLQKTPLLVADGTSIDLFYDAPTPTKTSSFTFFWYAPLAHTQLLSLFLLLVSVRVMEEVIPIRVPTEQLANVDENLLPPPASSRKSKRNSSPKEWSLSYSPVI
jgi:hypothetical protein